MTEPLDVGALQSRLVADNATWHADENPITSLEPDAQDRLLGVSPGPDDLSIEAAHAIELTMPIVTTDQARFESNAGAPARFDNRDVGGRDFTTPVKDQGSCGSCVAFGTVAVMETTYQRQHGRPSSGIDLSEAHMFFCHGGSEGRTCSTGWLPEPAFALAKQHGVATEDKYPYNPAQQACQVGNGWQSSKATSAGHTKLDTRAKMKDWISRRGSITGCFLVYSDFFAYRQGVYRRTTDEVRGGHCVEIIGYDDAQAAWICKNSWGTNWGDKGYVKIGYGQCRIEEWAGPYGVNGVDLRQWATTKVRGLYTTKAESTTWAYLDGHGWKALPRTTTQTQHAMLAAIIASRTADRQLTALLDGNSIDQVYAG